LPILEDSEITVLTTAQSWQKAIVLWRVLKGFDPLNPPKRVGSAGEKRKASGRPDNMRYVLTVDFEEDADIESFLRFVQYHSKRLKCPGKDVFIRLAHEWEKQLVNNVESTDSIGIKKEKKKALKEGTD
jgi:hypothetical protein